MTYDDDPRGQHIYSPEASDTQRHGDWQTWTVKIVLVVLFIVACSAIAAWLHQL